MPHALVGERVELRVTNAVVEIFHRARRVTGHENEGSLFMQLYREAGAAIQQAFSSGRLELEDT